MCILCGSARAVMCIMQTCLQCFIIIIVKFIWWYHTTDLPDSIVFNMYSI